MTALELKQALNTAIGAAREAGAIMRAHHRAFKRIDSATQHDIKLELDRRVQKRIEATLLRRYRAIPILGEEGSRGQVEAPWRWVVDPIDGTVNFAYGIPHCCTSIALQRRTPPNGKPRPSKSPAFETMAGVIYDPFCDELWTALRGKPARLNGKTITVSSRSHLAECLVSVGFAKTKSSMRRTIPTLQQLLPKVRKVRIMGSAALGLVYVASGRLDAYVERGLSIWDVAAGGLILESAGGDFWHRPMAKPHTFHIVASNGNLRQALAKYRA